MDAPEPRRLEVSRRRIDRDALVVEIAGRALRQKSGRLRAPRRADVGEILDESVLLTVRGRPVLVYFVFPSSPEVEGWRRAMREVKCSSSFRTAGLKSISRTVGFLPRLIIRRDFCSRSTSAEEHAGAHVQILEACRFASDLYAEYAAGAHALHLRRARRIRPEWTIPGTPFTSGIINRNNTLRYHTDAGNSPGAWSLMWGFRQHVAGGELLLPDVGLGLAISDRSLTMFCGQELFHGVAPMVRLRPSGYRITCVFYTLEAMWHCLPLDQEMRRIRELRVLRERRKAGLEPAP